MTLQEAKDQIARKHFGDKCPSYVNSEFYNEVAELYARSKATKAWYAGYTTLDPTVPSKVFDEFMEKEFRVKRKK